jgi:hypothetical protein
VWPEPVERIAQLLRDAGVQGRLEELLEDAEPPPGPTLQAHTFDCAGRQFVVLLETDKAVDRGKVARAGGCEGVRPSPSLPFPFSGAQVLIDRAAFASTLVWVEAGTPRHMLGLAPAQLGRLTRAKAADLARDAGSGEVDVTVRG